MIDALAVFDIGKTNIKLSLVDGQGRELVVRRRANVVVRDGRYPHHDVDGIEAWLLSTLRELAQHAHISAIVPITHGATAALIDDDGLVLPVVDYEHALPSLSSPSSPSQQYQYDALRPLFTETFSPALGVGLNLGRQLYWLQQSYPDAFARARHLLMYPQYWAWRLCGVMASEVTSLGCHTDLWQPSAGSYSSLVAACGWQRLMPPLRAAWTELGYLQPHLSQRTGLPQDCRVLCGVHDSNASLLRHLQHGREGPQAVLSTGTWVIAMALQGAMGDLQERSDMLANVNVVGEPVACMRFMGGREFAELAGPEPELCSEADLQTLIDQHTMALPCFSDCGGPFATQRGCVQGPPPTSAAARYALATLYCVLMTDYCLEKLQVSGAVVVEGSFTANPHFAALLAGTGEGRSVSCSQDGSGTTVGGWMLRHWEQPLHTAVFSAPVAASPMRPRGWQSYRQSWRAAVAELLGETA